ncbi:MAG: ABC transporter permease [Chloroflexi bacterium]|nr:ABC transporter permease [Chloroflexota bacterium]MCL5275463.1 ABC transporter permease [Chloroflexota bacterium]
MKEKSQSTSRALVFRPARGLTYQAGALLLSFLFITIIILLTGESPFRVVASLWDGAFGTTDQFARVFSTLTPLVLCSSGLIFTFTAGLYNLGVEGQIVAGAIAATFILREFQAVLPAPLVVAAGVIAGMLGGILWGLLAGVLKVFGKINEIFAGLGMNFVAQGLAIYLIFGPWKRPGIASMSGTEPFGESLWLGRFGQTDAAPVALIIAIVALALTIIIMRNTHFGLRLKAVGQNPRASFILGMPATRLLLSSFIICGAFAGLAGGLQVVGLFHRLVPSISSNLGYLALLVVMLISFNALWIAPVAFFFSALNVGSLQLPMVLRMESSLSGVIQGTLVLLALLARGFSERARKAAGGQ